jgi:isoleucyl-tRNA synthetase
MLSSSVMRGGELVIDKNPKPIKEVFRLVIKPILNCYDFFSMYANADSIKASFDLTSEYFMDRYIIFKCIQSCSEIQKALDKYDTQTATQSSERFFEILSNWYIRRSRERFWKSEINQDKIHAYNTLYSVLVLISKAIASLLPFTAEAIFLSLCNKPEIEHSVHLERFPELIDFKINHRLIKNMDKVMEACNVALHLRNELGIRVRQPLSKAIFVGVSEDSLDNDMERLVLDELNLKSWETLPKSEISKYANLKIKLNLPIIGKRIPEKVKELLAAVKNEQWYLANDKVSIAGVELESEEFQIIIETKDEYKKAAATLPNHDGLIILDTNINDELRAEGIIRDIVRVIQQTRKDIKLDITDRIELSIITTNDFIKDAVENWSQYIESQTLSKIKSKLQNIKITKDFMLDDFNISISISKI